MEVVLPFPSSTRALGVRILFLLPSGCGCGCGGRESLTEKADTDTTWAESSSTEDTKNRHGIWVLRIRFFRSYTLYAIRYTIGLEALVH